LSLKPILNSHSQDALPIVLGTAQLGMLYGIANRAGKPDFPVAMEIVKAAWAGGIRFFDTAQAYGESEEVLGKCFRTLGVLQENGPCVISKLRPALDLRDRAQVIESVDESIMRLGVKALWGLLLHRESVLEGDREVLRQLSLELKRRKKIKHFGVSVYSPEKALTALRMGEVDIVQLPFSVFDQRAARRGVFALASQMGKRIFMRSIYLQGLLLMDGDLIPPYLAFAKEPVERYDRYCQDMGLSRKLAAFAFVRHNAPDAFLVIGVESAWQVMENLSLLKDSEGVSLPDFISFASEELRLINPSNWKQ
jgi:aryl-alcohol dehydrogenase-like predicted oxidoreductase